MKSRTLALSFVLLLAIGCGSGGLGDLGGTIGDILGSSGSDDPSEIRGVVSSIDTRDRAILLDVSYINNLREDRRGQTVYYDSNTVVEYQGRTYSVTDLERGDEVEIRGRNDGGRFVAERIRVTRDVSR